MWLSPNKDSIKPTKWNKSLNPRKLKKKLRRKKKEDIKDNKTDKTNHKIVVPLHMELMPL